jgi:hypothetical protein
MHIPLAFLNHEAMVHVAIEVRTALKAYPCFLQRLLQGLPNLSVIPASGLHSRWHERNSEDRHIPVLR